MVFQNNVLAGGAGGSGTTTYAINQSIRFNDGDSPILKKTYGSAGTEETFTFSCWVKRGAIGAGLGGAGNYGLSLFSGGTNTSNYGEIRFESSGYGTQDSLFFYNSTGGSINMQLATTQLFRDTSAWYHIVCVMDTTNAVSSERMRIYVNGTRVTDFGTETYPSQNAVPNFNTATEHGVGGFAVDTDTRFFDGYLAEIVFIDGTALDSSSFGEYNSSGIWIPKDVSGLTFGTNGFHIDGRDSADLGDDESGNGNDYTASGLAANDQVSDSPTNNFAVLNPLDKGSNTTLANGNIEFTSSNDGGVRSSVFFNADKYYIEAIVGTYGNAFTFGIANPDRSLSADAGTDLADFYGWYINPTQNWIASGSNPWNTGNSSSSGSLDVMQMAVDASDPTSIKVFAGVNNTYYDSSGGTTANPSTGANPTATITGGEEWSIGFWNRDASASNIFVNFGQEGTFGGNKTAGGNSDANGIGNFFHSVPTGFKAICTKNLGS